MSSIDELIHQRVPADERLALLAFGDSGVIEVTRRELDSRIAATAHALQQDGLGEGDRVLLLAANRIEWIVLALATLRAGGVIVPVDTQMGAEDLAHVVTDAAPWRIVVDEASALGLPQSVPRERIYRLEDLGTAAGEGADNNEAAPAAPTQDEDRIAALFYTSGTTGPPKGVPLTHRNLISNVEGLLAEAIARPADRVLLPLPLHHVYPFSIGLLSVLAVGATLVLPRSLVGPRVVEALRGSEATILLGVPRLYEALWSRLEARVTAGHPTRRRIFHALLGACQSLQQRLGRHPGRWLFRPVMRRLAPRLRLAVSGGAALDPALGGRLEALGWTVATGYGLTETSPILTLNPPGEARLHTAGRPLPGVSIEIRDGEVLAKGPNVFTGYWNDALAASDILDADGWLHTGDAGEMDDDGFLHLAGRLSSTIVLPGGENIDPERIERALNAQSAIREAGVLEHDGRLTAVIIPETEGSTEATPEDAALAAVDHALQTLPRHHALQHVQVGADPLPRTRLGKLRRHRLRALYDDLVAGRADTTQAPIDPQDMAPEDQALLADRAALATWQYLAERFHDQRLTPDSRLARDLGLDSLSWVDMGMALRERAGIELADEAIARVETVRDLLQECIQAEVNAEHEGAGRSLVDALREPETLLETADRRALAPRGALRHASARVALSGCRLINRRYAHIEIDGEWPEHGPCLITPRHLSAYDPIALTAALSPAQLETTFWAGWTGLLFASAPRRAFSHIARILPIDPGAAPRRSLALAAACLERGHPLIWFPEGQRAREDALQPLRPGIGLLLAAHPVPVVPVWIEGTDHILPIGQRLPQPGQVRIRIGQALTAADYGDNRRDIVQSIETAMRTLGEVSR
jgi:long-chain acyl-CoA synthetase